MATLFKTGAGQSQHPAVSYSMQLLTVLGRMFGAGVIWVFSVSPPLVSNSAAYDESHGKRCDVQKDGSYLAPSTAVMLWMLWVWVCFFFLGEESFIRTSIGVEMRIDYFASHSEEQLRYPMGL